MFLGKIWLTSALIVIAVFSASAIYKSYSDLQEAKLIQEHIQIISDIKTLLAKQYNKNPQDITRDEIIAYLPKGGNWDKVLLLDRDSDSTLTNNELVNIDGKIILDENDKIKLLAIKAKLKDNLKTDTLVLNSGQYTLDVGFNKSIKENEKIIDESLNKAIFYMIQQIIYNNSIIDNSSFLSTVITEFTPHDSIYQDMGTVANDAELIAKKETYFRTLLKNRLIENKNLEEAKLYLLLKDIL